MDSSRSAIEEFLALLLKEAEGGGLELKAASKNGDRRQASDIAHRLKSGFGNAGALELARELGSLEEKALLKDCTDEQLEEHAETVAVAFNAVREKLLEWKRGAGKRTVA